MPGFLLHEAAQVACSHAGHATPIEPFSRVRVDGHAIVTQTSPYGVRGCQLGAAPGGPCTTAQFTTAALRIRATGVPVLLSDSQSVAAPTGAPLQIVVTQVRVRGH